MSGVIGVMLGAGGELTRKTLTVGDDGGPTSYGYAFGNYGSLSPNNTYTDRGGNSRTILLVAYSTATGNLAIVLSGTVSNSDTTFAALVVDGIIYTRASATYSNPSNSFWEWATSNVIGTSGTKTVQLT